MANYEKPDFWSLKAQKESYPARSVYKLKEIDEKFHLFRPHNQRHNRQENPSTGTAASSTSSGLRVLDLGASPGSWSLYILRKLGSGVTLIAADLMPLSRQYDKGLFDSPGFNFCLGDITQAETRDILVNKGPYDMVISDAAPSTTGNRSVDTQRSAELAEAALFYARTCLSAGGNLVLKIFQGGDSTVILKEIRQLFKTGRSYKPNACRSSSFETYYLGIEKRP